MVDIINAHPQLHHVETPVRVEVLKLSEVSESLSQPHCKFGFEIVTDATGWRPSTKSFNGWKT